MHRLWAITTSKTSIQALLAPKRPEGKRVQPPPPYLNESRHRILRTRRLSRLDRHRRAPGLPASTIPCAMKPRRTVGGEEGRTGNRAWAPRYSDEKPINSARRRATVWKWECICFGRHRRRRVHPVGDGRPVLLGYGLDETAQASTLADGDGEADIHPAAGGDDGVGMLRRAVCRPMKRSESPVAQS